MAISDKATKIIMVKIKLIRLFINFIASFRFRRGLDHPCG